MRDVLCFVRNAAVDGSIKRPEVDPSKLRAILALIRFAKLGISAKTLANVRANLTAAPREVGAIPSALPKVPTSLAWDAFLAPVQAEYHHVALSRFVNFCCVHKIEPHDVRAETAQGFKCHRGLEGRVHDGKSAGGISYGYRAVRTLQADGTLTTGLREIVPAEADIIRCIFTVYAAGLSTRSIASALNAEGIRSPENGKGVRTWGPSTISGNAARGTDILNNDLYIGRLVWNRQRFVKDPASGKRQARLNPPEAWIIEDVPELRIIEDTLWQGGKERQNTIRQDMNPAGVKGAALRPERARRPPLS